MQRAAPLLLLAMLVLCGTPSSAAAGGHSAATPEVPDGLAAALAQREYEASPNASGLQAPNRAHGLRTYFEPGGIRVHDRSAPGSPELLALALARVGRAGALSAVPAGEVANAGARVEIRRPGLVEWFVNSEAGLEQGFTLNQPAPGEGTLVLELAVTGATASSLGEDVIFSSAAGRRLRYGALRVVDARGRALPARFELASSGRLRIAVDDTGAVYPLVVDPLLTETPNAQLVSGQNNAFLGTSVASAGDVNGDGYDDIIVGAYEYDSGDSNEGAAFIFLGSVAGIASGNVSSAATRLESNLPGARLGHSVASAGDVNGDGYADVIVGAPDYDAGQGASEGVAFVFHGSGSGIPNGNPTTAATQLESDLGGSRLGYSVAGAGDVNGDGYADVIVGSHLYDHPQSNEGSAFVFLGSASGVADGNPSTAAAALESDQAGSFMGNSVASAGDVNADGYADVIVGAYFYHSGQTEEGAAFVFLGGASGISSGNPTSAASHLESNLNQGQLGYSVAGAGDVNGDGFSDVIVGANNYSNPESFEGAAFVFLGSGSGIVANGDPGNAAGRLESDQANARLGVSVAGAGDVNGDGYADVIAGATAYDAPQTDEGAAFVFLGSASGVGVGNPSNAFAQLEANPASGNMGTSVASAGDVNGDGYADVVVGNTGYHTTGSNEGAAFVYHGGAQGILDGNPVTAAALLGSDQSFSALGISVASAGDVNGDGYADVIVGASGYDAGVADAGAAFIYLGSASGLASGGPLSADTTLLSDQSGSDFGAAVASASDVNGDGYADVIVSADFYDAGETDEGAAFVFLGSASGVANGSTATAAARIESNQDYAQLLSVAPAGDVNGDGYADVILGSSQYSDDEDELYEGTAWLFLGSPTGIASGNPATAATELQSNLEDAHFGQSVAGAGDVNGDGYADVIVGSPDFWGGVNGVGGALVFLGSASGIASGGPENAAALLESDQQSSGFAYSVAGAGDVNGDGYADVIVGHSNRDAGFGQSDGGAFVFLGSASGIASGSVATAAAQLVSDQANAFLGFSVAGAGDVNGDGYADVIVGARVYDDGESEEGAAFVFLGSASGVASGTPGSAAARLEPDHLVAQLGASVAGAGDVNGDGYADVIVGAPLYDDPGAGAGAALVFYGGGNRGGRRALAQQIRGGGGHIRVQPWGASYDVDAFAVAAHATHPRGRGRVKLQVEACPAAVPFGHASCTNATSTAWTDVTATGGGVMLTQTVASLAENTLYRWRSRVLCAPYTVTQSGITPPPNPAHGPWRRLQGQAVEADLRIRLDTDNDGDSNGSDPDDDGDGLLDIHETDTGTYVSPTDTGTDPLDSDSDDDALLDGAEVALGTNPNDPDHDKDGDLDGADNCPLIVNASQLNSDAFAAGDACQCGDVNGDGPLTAADYQRAREHVVFRTSGFFDPESCDVNGDSACDVEDLAVLDRAASGVGTVVDACEAYTTP